MDAPVFKLKKVVKSKSESEDMRDFEGPLDLILFLLSKNKMEIQDISIALICDQYLAWIAMRQSMDLEIASEFIIMASQLMLMKSRTLLQDEEARTEMDDLIQSLEERRRNESYAKIRDMAARMEPLCEFGRNIITRNPEPSEPGKFKIYEYSQALSDISGALSELRNRWSTHRDLPSPEAAFREIARHEPYPVETKAKEILRMIREHGILKLLKLFLGCRTRSEIVATFLAILELCRSRLLRLSGPEDAYTVREGGMDIDMDAEQSARENADLFEQRRAG